ncbi:YcxB family protein [Actinosynnema sp. CA-248983]
MTISVAVPYDPKVLRRTLRFIVKRQFKWIQVFAVLLVLYGGFWVVAAPHDVSYGVRFLALAALLFFLEWAIVPWSMRYQWSATKADFRLTADAERFEVAYPAWDARYRWDTLDRVVETTDAWYLVFTKTQAYAVPKSAMTEEERAVFVELAQPVRARR